MLFDNLFDGKYKILKLLGSGGCGNVYLAENTRLRSLWAIKEIPCDERSREQVELEIEVLKRVKHPALPRIVDVVREGGSIYLVEDYIEGDTVERILKAQTRVTEGTALAWGLEICDIMIYLHAQKPEPIIYRDLKPSNIILSPEGTIRLVDFGSARMYKPDRSSDTIYIGTRGYAAPEQYGAGQTSKRSDIYSFGVTMLHILTGRRPGEVSAAGPDADIGSGGGADCDAVSGRLSRVLQKCVEPDARARYEDFTAVKSELSRIAGDIAGETAGSGNLRCGDNRAGGESRAGGDNRAGGESRARGMGGASREDGAAYGIAREAAGGAAYGIAGGAAGGARSIIGGAGSAGRTVRAESASSAGGAENTPPAPADDAPALLRRCATLSVAQNHEFALELAYHAAKRYGLRTLVLDLDFENAFSGWYLSAGGDTRRRRGADYEERVLLRAVDALYRQYAAPRQDPGIVDISAVSRFVYADPEQPGDLYWLNQPDLAPEAAGRLFDRLSCDGGRFFSRFLSELTARMDVCVLLTGSSVFSALNARCFVNSHFIVYPARADAPAIRAFNNTAQLAEPLLGVPPERFKYVVWNDSEREAVTADALWALSGSSLVGVVRQSKRRDQARREPGEKRPYAAVMEKNVQKDYDDIIRALGIDELAQRQTQKA
ncbi:MAG: serine/threonine protein kinase [Clostridiales bacterium]|jgi:hypothetical protein|nr:serine/threonine protein kinase [Clostridiales bacterium]